MDVMKHYCSWSVNIAWREVVGRVSQGPRLTATGAIGFIRFKMLPRVSWHFIRITAVLRCWTEFFFPSRYRILIFMRINIIDNKWKGRIYHLGINKGFSWVLGPCTQYQLIYESSQTAAKLRCSSYRYASFRSGWSQKYVTCSSCVLWLLNTRCAVGNCWEIEFNTLRDYGQSSIVCKSELHRFTLTCMRFNKYSINIFRLVRTIMFGNAN